MEKSSTSGTTLLATVACTAVVTLSLTLAAVYFLFTPNCDVGRRGVQVVDNMPERLEKMHHQGVTAIRAAGRDACLLVVGDKQDSGRQRTLAFGDDEIEPVAVRAMFGDKIAEYCGGRRVYAASEVAPRRHKRQAVDVSPLRAQKEGLRPSNACQNKQLVDCADGTGAYSCNTGTGEIYSADIKCNSATEFTLTLVPRCAQFEKTAGDRFIKCLQKFVLGTTGDFTGGN